MATLITLHPLLVSSQLTSGKQAKDQDPQELPVELHGCLLAPKDRVLSGQLGLPRAFIGEEASLWGGAAQ